MVIEIATGNVEFWWASIRCHGKSWHLFPQPNNIETLERLTTEDLARTVAGWVQDAIDGKFLSLSNPPHTVFSPKSSVAAERLARMQAIEPQRSKDAAGRATLSREEMQKHHRHKTHKNHRIGHVSAKQLKCM
jgi:hypothetical protein